MEDAGQLRLLLWRDYLIRKRQFITLAGTLWATGVMLCIYTVRINIDNQDFPTCQFPARALPSAGVLPFLQSFICSVSNECRPLDGFEEIPSYNESKLSKIQPKIAPLFNSSVLELAGGSAEAARLLATIADAADEPTFIEFSKNGLKFADLFTNPSRVKRYVTSHLLMDDQVAQSLMTSQISLQGIFNGNLKKCSADALSQTLVVENGEHLQMIAEKLCSLSKRDTQSMLMDLLYEINFSKYIKMVGNMYFKISGDRRIAELGDFVTALLRMTKLHNFLPPEALGLIYGKTSDFSYFKLDLVQKFVKLFEPTFGDTKEYQSILEFVDTTVIAIRYMNKIFGKSSETVTDVANVGDNIDQLDMSMDKINKVLEKATDVVSEKGETIDPFNVLSKLSTIILKFLPSNHKHDVLFYSTLLAKLMESAKKVIKINMNIQGMVYEVTMRNPDAVKLIKELPPVVVGKAFDALVSAERTQILTSKLDSPGQMFCDISQLQNFLLISQTEAESVKNKLCSDVWKNYIVEVVKSFGVSEVRNDINVMASLLIQETLGKDTSSQLYPLERDFQVLRSFTSALITMGSETRPQQDWESIFKGNDDLMKVVHEKAHLGKLMLISMHGALAKEIVKQNTILSFKISPVLLNTNTFVEALNNQLDATPKFVSERIRDAYKDIVMAVVMTANNEEKTYRALTTYSGEILCHGGDNAAVYIDFPLNSDKNRLAEVFCNASLAIESGLKNDSIVSKAIAQIKKTTHTVLEEVNWTDLISNIQNLYVKLDSDYPYIFAYSTYAMDQVTQENVKQMCENAKDYWFGINNLQRGLHLSVNLGFRLLDFLNHGIFDMTNDVWLQMKFALTKLIGPLNVIDDTIQLVTGLLTNSSYTSSLPPKTVQALSALLTNLPQLIVDSVHLIIHDDTDIEPVISLMNGSPPWPCSSISELLEMTTASRTAVRAIETLLCLERPLQDEWTQYLDARTVKIGKTDKFNTTHYHPQLFLKMSATFSALASDAGRVRATLKHIVDEGSTERLGLVKAWEYAREAATGLHGKEMLGKFFGKCDTVLNSIESPLANGSLNALWEGYVGCVNGSYVGACGGVGREVWGAGLKVMATVLEAVVEDLTTYFTEVNDPGSNLLQLVGFTKSTALYMLLEKLPDFLGVLLNSYWDLGFISQVRRATLTQFWDCGDVVSALVPPPGSAVSKDALRRVEPYLCPSLLYWISLPRDDNVLFNVIAKPQYYFYSFPAQNATSRFESAFTKGVGLADILTNIKISKDNITTLNNKLKPNTIKDKLANFIDNILNYKLNKIDDGYKQFTDINKKQFASTVYLTRVVAVLNKLATAITNITIDNTFAIKENINEEDITKLNADLTIMKNIFRRKATDAIAIHYDLLTDMLWTKEDNFDIIVAMDAMCADLKANESKTILVDEVRTKAQICAKNYKVLYGAVQDLVKEDFKDSRQSLLNFIKMLRGDDEVTDVFQFINSRTELVASIKHNIKFSYDLGLPIYLKYLQSNLQSYKVLLTFSSGGNWWEALRTLYGGPEATKFFGYLEQVFDVADNVLRNLDSIHLVRLIRDINVNSSASFCRPELVLSDFVPDATGALSALKDQLCGGGKVDLFGELPPMKFASQGYEASLQISREVEYESINADILAVESGLALLADGPADPARPAWVTDLKLELLRTDVMNLLSKETLTKISFGILANAVDAGTLFLNDSECTRCSQVTTWLKQLNLQVFKKQEYDNLLCHVDAMTSLDVHYTLKNDFHWDMFIKELISSRNYTKYELNKSMHEFLGLVEVHLLEDVGVPVTKLAECLARNVSRNSLGHAALFLQVVAHTAKLLRAETPYLQEVEGIKTLPYFTQLHKEVAHNLDVFRPLKEYLNRGVTASSLGVTDDEVLLDLMEADLNLRAVERSEDLDELIRLKSNDWESICEERDCGAISSAVRRNLNATLVRSDLAGLQSREFWSLSFVRRSLRRGERTLAAVARLAGTASRVDLAGAVVGRPAAVLDVAVSLLADENVHSVLYSVEVLLEEVRPLLKGTALEGDLKALAGGLRTLHQFRTYLLEQTDLKVNVSRFFPNPGAVESGLSALGINNTNFWSLAAPTIRDGYLYLKPVIAPKAHIGELVCDMEAICEVLAARSGDPPGEAVCAAVVEQLCGLGDEEAKEMLGVILGNADFSPLLDTVKEHLLSQLYSRSALTPGQGAEVLARLPRLAALLPTLQHTLGPVMEDLEDEPLLENLRDFSSLGSLVSSSDFMSNAGHMLCGAPFQSNVNRMIGNILKSKDLDPGVSREQLDALPNEYCRSMYREIISMEGGKILWSFVKPLVMGKILYTPPLPRVQAIMQRANSTFATMIQMTSLVHSGAAALPALETMSSHRGGVAALRRLMTAPAFEGIRRQLLGDVDLDLDLDVEGMFDKMGDLKSIGKLLSQASNLLQCMNLDRLVATQNETTLMEEAAQLSRVNELSAGLVFLNADRWSDFANVEYKIRMDIENGPTTARMKNFFWVPGPEASFVEDMRYFRGFIQIQDMVDKAIIQLAGEGADAGGRGRGGDWALYTQQEPYPCYRKDFFQTSLYESQALLVGFFFSLVFTVTSAVRFIVADKETGNTMLMSVMGVNLKYHTLSWFISSYIEMAVTQACVTAVLTYGGILPRTDPTLVYAMLMLFGASVLSFCYLMSKLFSSASSAAVCGGLGYLVSFMPIVLILSLEVVMSSQLKLLVCLSMSSALCYAFLFVTRFEATGRGAGWADLYDSPTDMADMNIAYAMGMVAFDAVLYLCMGWLIDHYWGIRSIRSSITTSTKEKGGVSIVSVSKTYSSRHGSKVALENVSMELREGEITTLLGHNGAGKTTLTKILTGTVRPTSGHVTMGHGSCHVGTCPQRDVLVECLSAREHVALYAGLARDARHSRAEDVQAMLEVLSLGHVGDVAVSRLSGGTRRRVCVALAFVARPTLVALDEPTSGVDPKARREIWDMILKLKTNCTILLTTHHLDEAEVLSDQLVILHKGRVHTTGSPIEIKRSLGIGYKLTVDLPEPRGAWTAEEQSKAIVATVRGHVTNAAVTDLSGPLEIQLPFCDADGGATDYHQLCQTLEQQQPTLGFSSFTMDCSTLEQVFCDICQKADSPDGQECHVGEGSSKSVEPSGQGATWSEPLVPCGGARRGSRRRQLGALLRARVQHLQRNRPLLFMLVGLPTLFVAVAMAFSMLRPPPDNETSLLLSDRLYDRTTQYSVPFPSIYSQHIDPSFAEHVMRQLQMNKMTKEWEQQDSPTCKCAETRQVCETDVNSTDARPEMMLVPDVDTLNAWLVLSRDTYIEKRYGGYTSTLTNNKTALVAWYNNKGHHAMPAFLNMLNNAILRTVAGADNNITTYSHPLKISKEQLSKDTVYQHIADAGICALVLVAFSAAAGGGAAPLVGARVRKEKRLQLLSAVSPAAYWGCALLWDLMIMFVNMCLTAAVMSAFGFPVFVERNNLLAICILIMLFGYACGALVHLTEKLFLSASLANMMLFCGNAFLGLAGISIMLVFDIVSQSDATDNARWALHKVFLLSPQFALGDGMLEIAKNTIQAQVLYRFGMDTYRDPLTSPLVRTHCLYLVVVGTALLLLNLAIEYGCFESLLDRCNKPKIAASDHSSEPADVSAERRRVASSLAERDDRPLSLSTIGNINRGFVHTEGKKNSLQRSVVTSRDVLQCANVTRAFGSRLAVGDLTLGVSPGQCLALLGENGAGKSTTFAMLSGELRPTRGQIYLDGRQRDARGLCRGLISYCPQSDAIDPLLTVEETLQLYCRLRGITEEEDVISRTIQSFDLRRYPGVLAGALSGGNRRKLCAALAFMARTPLVLLDEPTTGMDPVSRGCVRRGTLAARAARRGVLLATHALDDARSQAARVAMLRDGRLAAVASLQHCLHRFGGGYVVQCACAGDAARSVRQVVARRVRGAELRGDHRAALHYHVPATTTVDDKEVVTNLSEIFLVMSELQAAGLITDFAVNQSSLDQMFLSFKKPAQDETIDIEPLPHMQRDAMQRDAMQRDGPQINGTQHELQDEPLTNGINNGNQQNGLHLNTIKQNKTELDVQNNTETKHLQQGLVHTESDNNLTQHFEQLDSITSL